MVQYSTHSHAVLLAELLEADLVYGGGHIFHWLLQVFTVALHQGLGDTTPTMLAGERNGERERLWMSGESRRGTQTNAYTQTNMRTRLHT